MSARRLTQLHQTVLGAVREAGPEGTTADPMQVKTELSHQNSNSRLSELLSCGVIIRKPLTVPHKQGRTYERRRTSSNRFAAVLVLPDSAK